MCAQSWQSFNLNSWEVYFQTLNPNLLNLIPLRKSLQILHLETLSNFPSRFSPIPVIQQTYPTGLFLSLFFYEPCVGYVCWPTDSDGSSIWSFSFYIASIILQSFSRLAQKKVSWRWKRKHPSIPLELILFFSHRSDPFGGEWLQTLHLISVLWVFIVIWGHSVFALCHPNCPKYWDVRRVRKYRCGAWKRLRVINWWVFWRNIQWNRLNL